MKLNKDMKILIVGLGVIGGAYAKRLTELGYRVDCITKEEKDIAYALMHGMIERGSTEVSEELLKDADLVMFALYPTVFIEWIEKYGHLFKKGAVITDVSGVKSSVVGRVKELLSPDVEYISTHPMAGREMSGVEFSDPGVFKGANYIITPTEDNTEGAIELMRDIAMALGFARVSLLSPKEHDEMIAFLSQLTHCIAVTLMTANRKEGLEKYTGDSFRDLTRIAKINDRMWSELFLMNKDALLSEMDAFEAEFSRLRSLLASADREGIQKMMRDATARRALFDKPRN